MTSRERVLAALNHEEPDRVPLFFGTSGVTSILGPGYGKLKTHLPAQWATGHYRGLKARGAFTVDCSWMDGKVTAAAITSLKGTPCKLRNSRPWKTVKVTSNSKTVEHTLDAGTGTIGFATRAGTSYKLEFE